jgi:hypothetical protein
MRQVCLVFLVCQMRLLRLLGLLCQARQSCLLGALGLFCLLGQLGLFGSFGLLSLFYLLGARGRPASAVPGDGARAAPGRLGDVLRDDGLLGGLLGGLVRGLLDGMERGESHEIRFPARSGGLSGGGWCCGLDVGWFRWLCRCRRFRGDVFTLHIHHVVR